jgi:uncharacterized protein (DUF736 family)
MNDYQKPFETKDFTGALFRNDKKETDQHPDYKGSAVINQTEMWVSAWINTSAKGQKYMSLKFTEKQAVQQQGMAQVRQAAAPDPVGGFEDDIPFAQFERGTFA